MEIQFDLLYRPEHTGWLATTPWKYSLTCYTALEIQAALLDLPALASGVSAGVVQGGPLGLEIVSNRRLDFFGRIRHFETLFEGRRIPLDA